MSGNGKVFVCHAYQDTDACQPLLAALASWGVECWFQAERTEADETLSPQVEQAIADHDTFLRVCSAAARVSYWVRLETETFRRLRDDEHERDGANKRLLIDVSLDASDLGEPDEEAAAHIRLMVGSEQSWHEELRHALGLVERELALETEVDPGTETGEVPALSTSEALTAVMSLAQQLRALHKSDDTVVSVAPADRQTSGDASGPRGGSLVMVEGRESGRTYQLLSSRVTLGRRLDNDIFLADMAVSRYHASIGRDHQGRFVLRDENSKNGTYVNGQSILERVLEDGDSIRLGHCVLQFRRPHNDD